MNTLRELIEQRRSGQVSGGADASSIFSEGMTSDVSTGASNEAPPAESISPWWVIGGAALFAAIGGGAWWYLSRRKHNPARLAPSRGLARDTIAESIEQGIFHIKRPDLEFLRDKWLLRLRECEVCGRKLPPYLVNAGVCSEECAVRSRDPEVLALFRSVVQDLFKPASAREPESVSAPTCLRCGRVISDVDPGASTRRKYCSSECARAVPAPARTIPAEQYTDRSCRVCGALLLAGKHVSQKKRRYIRLGYCGQDCAERELGPGPLPEVPKYIRLAPTVPCKQCGKPAPRIKDVPDRMRTIIGMGFCSRECWDAFLGSKMRKHNPARRKSMRVQTLLFPRELFTKAQAKAWARRHGYAYGKVDATANYYRLRQHDPAEFKFFRMIVFGDSGIKAVVGR